MLKTCLVAFEHGEELEGALLVQVVGRLQAEVARHQVVGFDSSPEVRYLGYKKN